MWVVNLHLHPSILQLRDAESKRLERVMPGLVESADHVVVMGDFNSEVTETFQQYLKRNGFMNAIERIHGAPQATMDTAGIKLHYIDHIYASPALAETLTSAEVVRWDGFRVDEQTPGVWVHSDHLPVIAEFGV